VEEQDHEGDLLMDVSLGEKLKNPSLNHFPGDQLLERMTDRVGVKPEVLAEPPAGSGWEPVLGERGLPLVGKTIRLLRNGQQYAVEYYEKYGPVFWNGAFGQQMVWAIGPDAAQQVLTNKEKVWSQSGWQFFIGPFFNRGLMLLDGHEHLLHRRIMQEAFTRPRLEGYLTHINKLIDETVPEWGDDEPLLMFPAVKSLSLDIATKVFMGSEHSPEAEKLTQAFIDTVRAGTGFIRVGVPGMPWLRWNRGLRGRKVLEDYFRPLIAEKRASADDDLFAVLTHVETEDGHRFSDDDIVNHMIFLMMAAHDTSTITASSVAYYLAKNPDWQDRARAESQAVGDAPVDLGMLEKLETLDLVFKEAMRLVAPVPAFVRRATEDTEIGGKYIPADTIVAVVPGALHILPDHWGNPDDFEPDRFSEPRREDKGHRFQSVPFGGGAHKCIGMAFGTAEVKALLHRMLLEYRFEVPAGYEVEWDHTSLAVPTDGMPITLRRIS
jgi:cytochrome P450